MCIRVWTILIGVKRQKVGASRGSRALATSVSGAISFSLHIMLCLVVEVVFKKIG